jgi:hypothetical protein
MRWISSFEDDLKNLEDGDGTGSSQKQNKEDSDASCRAMTCLQMGAIKRWKEIIFQGIGIGLMIGVWTGGR